MNYKPDYKYIPPATWSVLTPFYDFICTTLNLGKRFKLKVLKAVEIKEEDLVADVGCGTGIFLKIAKEKYPKTRFVGIDPDAGTLAVAKGRFTRSNLQIELKQAFAESLPLHNESVDTCFSTLTLHHMPNEIKLQAIKEMHRVLKPGGVAVIADFGESRNLFLRKLLFFEKMEYLEGNLKGLIPIYLREAEFRQVEVIGTHFPGIKIVKAHRGTQ